MALAFFRRRQKMVMIIMVILMVAFLVGFQGFEMLFPASRGGKAVMGTSKYGTVTNNDLALAASDLRVLGLLNRNDLSFQVLLANDQPALAYALLLQEAEKSSIPVGSEDETEFLERCGIMPANMPSIMVQLRSYFGEGFSEKYLRQIARRWLLVEKKFQQSFVPSPPSQAQLERLFRDLEEKIDLLVVRISAEDFLKQAGEPPDSDVTRQFIAFRDFPPGGFSENNPFGFGYKQPNKARILYMLIRQDVIERVSRPSDDAVRAYFHKHSAELVKKVQLPAASTEPAAKAGGKKSAAASATAPATAPAQFRTEPMTFSEARAQIIEKLSASVAQSKVEELLSRAKTLIHDYETTSEATKLNAYQWALTKMTMPAQDALARKLEGLAIQAQPLDKAVDILAGKAALTKIVFPWTSQGEMTLDPNVKVTLKGDMSLGDALDQICRQIKWPDLQWSMFAGFEGTLFSVFQDGKGVDFAPVTVKETGLLDLPTMRDDPVLGVTHAMNDVPLENIVFTSEPFFRGKRGGNPIKVGEDGPRMIVGGPRPGQLLWRMMEASPSHSPERLDAVEGLRDQVKKDLKIILAFKLAAKRANELRTKAAAGGLAEVAKDNKLQTFDTGLFPREIVTSPVEQYLILAKMTGRTMTSEIALSPPYRFVPTEHPELKIGPAQATQFNIAAFALAPANVEPPYNAGPPSVGLSLLPSLREVLVMQRIGYSPAVKSQYDKMLPSLIGAEDVIQRWQARLMWFGLSGIGGSGILQRTEFRPAGAERRGDQTPQEP